VDSRHVVSFFHLYPLARACPLLSEADRNLLRILHHGVNHRNLTIALRAEMFWALPPPTQHTNYFFEAHNHKNTFFAEETSIEAHACFDKGIWGQKTIVTLECVQVHVYVYETTVGARASCDKGTWGQRTIVTLECVEVYAAFPSMHTVTLSRRFAR